MKEEVVEVQCGIPQESIAYRHLQLSAILMVSNGEESFAIESLPLICHPYIYFILRLASSHVFIGGQPPRRYIRRYIETESSSSCHLYLMKSFKLNLLITIANTLQWSGQTFTGCL